MWAAEVFASLRDFFFPPSCLVCGSTNLYRRDYLICVSCTDSIPWITHPLCLRCGKPLATAEGKDHLCGDCVTEEHHYVTKVRGLCKYEGAVADMIHQLKYQERFAFACIFRLLEELTPERVLDFPAYDCLVPVPLHRARLRQRGFNQAVIWGKVLEKKYLVPMERKVLKRIRCTPPQVALQGKARRENVRNAFMLHHGAGVNDKTILLLDDVYTTGATMNECARILRQGGASRVDGFVIARAG